jgi:hypothetical protein
LLAAEEVVPDVAHKSGTQFTVAFWTGPLSVIPFADPVRVRLSTGLDPA